MESVFYEDVVYRIRDIPSGEYNVLAYDECKFGYKLTIESSPNNIIVYANSYITTYIDRKKPRSIFKIIIDTKGKVTIIGYSSKTILE